MDPDATWRELLETLQDLRRWPESKECRAHAIDLLEDLAAWFSRGGFPPTINPEPQKDV